MTTEPKQLTPTERVKRNHEEHGHRYQLLYPHLKEKPVDMSLALELAAELERVQKEADHFKSCRDTARNHAVEAEKELDSLKRQVEELKIDLQLTASARITAELNCDQLRAENAELRKDKDGLDWLLAQYPQINHDPCGNYSLITSRQAIDAARKETK